MYRALRGHLPAKHLALFKMRHPPWDGTVRCLTCIQMLSSVNTRRASTLHSPLTVQQRDDSREFPVVDVETVLGLAHLILKADRRWLVNNLINPRTLNEIY